ncbi:amino acid ABC transporter permease [Thermocoleostomius sinensis]|uniref:Amino acid ABC transporter permease n=1 Tax=Thermocoleostomius sinensis A174 TaxID=2016057 RepID=A0A9E8ZGD5_9CYAN|nr:amino acid ABC transporter permease [Thermocoleostomius sinensis]WAL62587.1 amino acid ABC transporter permease [Thermocoleostomius sinensis A174]
MTTTHPPSSASPPPVAQIGPVAWLRKNLFSDWFNSLLTIVILLLLFNTLTSFLGWATTVAQWQVIPANWPLFFVGRFPAAQYWRLWVVLALIASLAGLSWGILARNAATLFTRPVLAAIAIASLLALLMPTPIFYRLLMLGVIALLLIGAWVGRRVSRTTPTLGKWIPLVWFLSFFVVLWLMAGGFGLPAVSTSLWGGLLLTIFMAVVSIVLCFPLGVLLALGRQSSLPVIRWLSVLYIEIIRGIPLIAILFIGQNMIPLFLPQGVRPDNILRAIIGLTIFSAAYLAENVRGGLQAIPRGQTEAANALGLNPMLTTGLIVLPQALKISIPAIVGQFISLLQDTTLLAIVGIIDLLGITRAILANPQFIGRYWEAYIFIGAIYWVLCYGMSLGSRRLEESLNTGH